MQQMGVAREISQYGPDTGEGRLSIDHPALLSDWCRMTHEGSLIARPLLPPDLPPLTQEGEEIGRQDRIAIPAPFPLFDPDQHALTIDVVDFEHRHLSGTQTHTIGN